MASAVFAQNETVNAGVSDMNKPGWIKKGYRGFLEIAGGADIKKSMGSMTVNTTHGRQFSSWFFMGGGIGYTYSTTKAYYRVPDDPKKYYYTDPHHLFYTYMDMRLTIPTRSRIYPFLDFKIGPAFGQSPGYINGQAGARYALNKNLGVSLSMYYTNIHISIAPAAIMGVTTAFDF